MRFGVFFGPFHKLGQNPNLALHKDLKLVEHLDEFGYDEAWIGEHHSSGVETIASPELFIAAAAERTKRIRLGTGVSSLPYHNPFILADRIVMLDHLTRGRIMFGVGPGQLLEDAEMQGIDMSTSRPRMEESLDVIMRLFRGEAVTRTSDWFDLRDARLQWKPYSDFEVAVTAAISPSGPKLAGKHGASLLSLAATDPVGVERLADHWDVAVAEAERHGNTVSRDNWRLMGPMYVAETLEQAKRDVEYGLPWMMGYLSHITEQFKDYSTVSELVDALNESGRAVIGTPEMAIEQLSRLEEKSGGFGTYLFQELDYARFPRIVNSYELFASEVMPHFNGQLAPMQESHARVVASGHATAEVTARVQSEAAARYASEVAAR
jgi:limonene 1,2-monooxygenase